MADPQGTPSLARRFAFALARLGLDLEPAFQRARNLVLRPVRHEMQDERQARADAEQQLRGECESLRLESAAHGVRLASLESTLQQQRESMERVEAELRGQVVALGESARQQRRRGSLLEAILASTADTSGPLRATGETLVSVILPTRDRARLLHEAIESVLAQTYPHWELIIIDDGSVDDSARIATRYLHDARIRLERTGPEGASAARNLGLRLAMGELIAYLDSDNAWYPGFLDAAVAAMDAAPGCALAYGALVTSEHGEPGGNVLLEDFDRERLLQGNYIDLNTVVHRRELFERLGGFDEGLDRLIDWELLLRYTQSLPARPLPVLAAHYRRRDELRITDTRAAGPNWLRVQERHSPLPVPATRPRVLYVVWHYPQLSETYLNGEIRCMQRFGAEVELWRSVGPASPCVDTVPVHEGPLREVVERVRPDAIHVHWLSYALSQDEALTGLGVPVTVRMHGFDVRPAQFERMLSRPWLHRAYVFPRQLGLPGAGDPRVCAMPAAFDTGHFPATAEKDPRLVLRAGACIPSKDIGLFMELAKRCPRHRFVFAGVTCNEWEHYPAELRRLRDELQSPVELRFDLPRGEMAALFARAGTYLHTIHPPTAEFGAPIGMPISIAEAMATGAYVLVRDLPELVYFVGDAGVAYADAADAARLLEATLGWQPRDWLRRRIRAIDRAFLGHADAMVLRPLYLDWCALAARRETALAPAEAAPAA